MLHSKKYLECDGSLQQDESSESFILNTFFPVIVVLLTEKQNISAKSLKISKLFPWTHGKELKFSFKIFLAIHAYSIFN